MAEEQIDLASKDVFILLEVPIPENLETSTNWQELTENKDEENESQLTLDEDDKLHFHAGVEPHVVDVTPPEELDYSSSDSMTLSEIEGKRWYNPSTTIGLGKSDFDSLKALLNAIKNTDPIETLSALSKLKIYKQSGEAYQNMFVALNGFVVLVNLLECNNEDCMKEALTIIHEMSVGYGNQCSLCNLDAVKPLISILLFKKNVNLRHLAADTLQEIAKLRKGRKLIRLSGGIRILVQIMDESKSVLSSSMDRLSRVNQTIVQLISSCSGTLRMLCRSKKSQEDLWNTGFVTELLSRLLNTEHNEIQMSTMSLVSKCCRPSRNDAAQKTDVLYKLALKELNLLPKIVNIIVNDNVELAANAAETILECMRDDDNSVYDVLLMYKGMDTIFQAIRKFENEKMVMVSVMTLLWKCSLNVKCRDVIEKDGIMVSYLMDLLAYPFDSVVGYAVATLSELWKSESLRAQLKHLALPKLMELLNSSHHSLILSRVCNVLGRASSDPDCMEIVNGVDCFRSVFALLASLEVDEFDKYGEFYAPDLITAAAKCLTAIIGNTPTTVNNLKGMYEALCDLVDLLKHTDSEVLAAVCRLIENVASFEDNLKTMIDVGVIDNLADLITTEHTNLRANLCRALGKCCTGGVIARRLSCKNIVDELLNYIESKHQIVKDNVPMALSGLSKDPLNCIKIEALGFIPFLKQAVQSENSETAEAAANCMKNIRKVCSAIGEYQEQCLTRPLM